MSAVRLSDLSPAAVDRRLRGPGLRLACGPFTWRLRSNAPPVTDGLPKVYAHHRLLPDDAFIDFDLAVERDWSRRRVRFRFEGGTPFQPLPAAQAMPMLEWGMNWAVAMHAHDWLILHAAVVARPGAGERPDRAVLLPGPPGAGKSTLCAALVAAGWRLLSDELCMIAPDSGLIAPMPRPLSLKNRAIGILRRRWSGAVFTAPCETDAKGTVALLRPPAASVTEGGRPAEPAAVVFPRYAPGADGGLSDRSRARSCIDLAQQAFNLGIHARHGFDALADIVEAVRCHDLVYDDLDTAVAALEALIAPPLPDGPRPQVAAPSAG